MNEALKDKLVRKLEAMSDAEARQLLDYLEFLESKYNRSQRKGSPFEKISETIESAINPGKVRDAAAKGASDLAETAGRIMGGIAAAARSAAEEFQRAAQDAASEESEESEEAAGEAGEGDTVDKADESHEARGGPAKKASKRKKSS